MTIRPIGRAGMLVATIGNFDGVHLGHQALVAAARREAGASGRTVAVTFEPLPASVLRPADAPPRLTDARTRERLLLEAGCDEVHTIDPREGVLGEDPEAFIASLRRTLPFGAVVEGTDFRFGRGRSGDIGTLRALGARGGFRAIAIDDVDVDLPDGGRVAARSSLVRWMLAVARVADAARRLGRAHAVRGTVERGDRRGRTLGFPTANIGVPSGMLPRDGVYAGRAVVDGRTHPAAISIGTKPTFGRSARTCEAHVIGLSRGADDYGWEVELRFDAWIRGQWRFPGPEALAVRLREDVAECESRARAAAVA
ncbi:MAG: bifunctional riboflavin kinase/FMN adenylyltransferase [Phycisphaerales bacterium]